MRPSRKYIKLLAMYPNETGEKYSYIPELGDVIWTAAEDCPFDAYIFVNAENNSIGYVRIPEYIGDAEEIKAFEELIQRFESVTDALVIDEINNPGGYLFYLYALASTLTEKPLYTPKHRVTLTQEDIFYAQDTIEAREEITNDEEAKEVFGDTLQGYPVTYQMTLVIDYFRFIINEWEQGHYLTAPTHIYGIDQINPNQNAHYTKPILVLVNELDFSGGDFFPAILQDNKRATIMGTRTAGAGGYVTGFSYPNRFGMILLHLTGSIAERIEGKAH